LTQGNVAVLNGILEIREPREYRNVAGDVITFAPGVSFYAADNTNGTGDPSGHFIGAQPMNEATLQRFAYFIRLDYLTRSQEARVLRKRTGATKEQCHAIAAVMSACREKAQSGHLPCAPSMRGAVAFLRATTHGVPPSDAFEAAVTARSAPEAQEELRALFVAHWPAAMTPAQDAAQGSIFGALDSQSDDDDKEA
jgi:MoxR-like ATPase